MRAIEKLGDIIILVMLRKMKQLFLVYRCMWVWLGALSFPWVSCLPKKGRIVFCLIAQRSFVERWMIEVIKYMSTVNTTCYKLHVFYLPKFACWNLNSQYDGIRRWEFGKVIRSWEWNPHHGGVFMVRKRINWLFFLFIMGILNGRQPSASWEESLNQMPDLPAHWIWTSQHTELC